jgi:hypothetical protein
MLPRYRFHSLALPALAHRYGPLPVERFIELLCRQLQSRPPQWQGELWLLLPRHNLNPSLQLLERMCSDYHAA